MNDPGTHARLAVFSMLNYEDCSFGLFEAILKSFCRSGRAFRAGERTQEFATMNLIRISG
jgi:hypothetical protein